MSASLRETLLDLGLLAEDARVGRGDARDLFQWCHDRALTGGLSIALDLRPDELIGSLTHLMGGAARKLKVLDVRGDKQVELTVQFAEAPERWELEDLPHLVDNLNDAYRDARGVRVTAVLGEWEDMLQLWCIEKATLAKLLKLEDAFQPANRFKLERLLCAQDL